MRVKYTSAVSLNISISISLQNSTWFWRKSRWWLPVAMSLTSSQLDQPRAHSRATFNEKSNFKYLFPNEGDPSQWCKAIILNLLLINACDPQVQEEKQSRKSLVCARCNYFCTQGYDFKKRIWKNSGKKPFVCTPATSRVHMNLIHTFLFKRKAIQLSPEWLFLHKTWLTSSLIR